MSFPGVFRFSKSFSRSQVTFQEFKVAKHCWEADQNFSWEQNKVVDRESGLIPRKIKESIQFLKNPNHINKISCILPEIWLPNLQ